MHVIVKLIYLLQYIIIYCMCKYNQVLTNVLSVRWRPTKYVVIDPPSVAYISIASSILIYFAKD